MYHVKVSKPELTATCKDILTRMCTVAELCINCLVTTEKAAIS